MDAKARYDILFDRDYKKFRDLIWDGKGREALSDAENLILEADPQSRSLAAMKVLFGPGQSGAV